MLMIISRKTHMINRAMSTTTTTTTASTATTSTSASPPLANITNSSTAGGSFFSNLVLGPSQKAEELRHLKVRESDSEAKKALITVRCTCSKAFPVISNYFSSM